LAADVQNGGVRSDQGPASAEGRRWEEPEMKYMIMMFGGVGDAMAGKSPEWIAGFHELIMKLDTELRESGELVDSQKLMDPGRARTVRLVDGAPVPTDGPFAEVKESLAGYWVIEATEDRALQVTSQVVGYSGYPMEVRRIMDEPPQE
jgi:hypothetical protein